MSSSSPFRQSKWPSQRWEVERQSPGSLGHSQRLPRQVPAGKRKIYLTEIFTKNFAKSISRKITLTTILLVWSIQAILNSITSLINIDTSTISTIKLNVPTSGIVDLFSIFDDIINRILLLLIEIQSSRKSGSRCFSNFGLLLGFSSENYFTICFSSRNCININSSGSSTFNGIWNSGYFL